jgi:hypothetical protein
MELSFDLPAALETVSVATLTVVEGVWGATHGCCRCFLVAQICSFYYDLNMVNTLGKLENTWAVFRLYENLYISLLRLAILW